MGEAPHNSSTTSWTVQWSLHLTAEFVVLVWWDGWQVCLQFTSQTRHHDTGMEEITASMTLEWRELQPLNQADGPMRKAGCGMITDLQNQLATFGGHSFCTGPTQPGAMFTVDTNGKGWSNELHIFDITRGM